LFINLIPFRLLLGNPIPLYPPFPLLRGRGNGYVREATPLFDSPSIFLLGKERGRIGFERASPLQATLINT